MTRRTMFGAVAGVALAMSATVLAHMKLTKSLPAADSMGSKPPQIQIWFTQAPDKAVSKIGVSGTDLSRHRRRWAHDAVRPMAPQQAGTRGRRGGLRLRQLAPCARRAGALPVPPEARGTCRGADSPRHGRPHRDGTPWDVKRRGARIARHHVAARSKMH